jgi:hypothetical protein
MSALQVARGLEHRPQASHLAAIVHKRQHDGHAGLLGDEVKAGFPVPRLAARALGRHDQLHGPFGGTHGLGRAGHQVARLAPGSPESRPASASAPPKGARNMTLLAHPVHPQIQRERPASAYRADPSCWCGVRQSARSWRHAAGRLPSTFQPPSRSKAIDRLRSKVLTTGVSKMVRWRMETRAVHAPRVILILLATNGRECISATPPRPDIGQQCRPRASQR